MRTQYLPAHWRINLVTVPSEPVFNNMYICMYVCMYVFMYVCVYYVCVNVCVYIYVCMCVRLCVCVCVCLCMYVCIYVCMYACVCVYVHMQHGTVNIFLLTVILASHNKCRQTGPKHELTYKKKTRKDNKIKQN